MGASKTSDHIKNKIKMPNPNQEPLASSKAPNEDLKDMDDLWTFKIRIESQNWDHRCIKDQWPYKNQDQDGKPQSIPSSILQSPKKLLKGHICSLHLQNQGRELKFGTWVYQWPVNISKSRSRSQTPVRNLQPPIRIKWHECSWQLQNQDIELKFGTWVYRRPMTITKSRSRCQTLVRNLQPPPKSPIKT